MRKTHPTPNCHYYESRTPARTGINKAGSQQAEILLDVRQSITPPFPVQLLRIVPSYDLRLAISALPFFSPSAASASQREPLRAAIMSTVAYTLPVLHFFDVNLSVAADPL
ncbi:hypothetical protein GJ744_006945 [Endocarpon pusillum]|uniref:Uncharacterized protein n=1 Tax=Endocarpon pusillum TaxID=364733 RepID=A0A8H7E4J3_9EURO|nr:hypothetical protein GJ744_006945 [Endocarpon pusillum]